MNIKLGRAAEKSCVKTNLRYSTFELIAGVRYELDMRYEKCDVQKKFFPLP